MFDLLFIKMIDNMGVNLYQSSVHGNAL